VAHWKATGPKPKHRFCWICSRQLYGRQFAEIVGDDGHKHAVHKACAKTANGSDNGDAERDYSEDQP